MGVREFDLNIEEPQTCTGLEFNASFQFKFVDTESLTSEERKIFSRTPEIMELLGVGTEQAPAVRISETMRSTSGNTEGVWDPLTQTTIVKRSKLADLTGYAATLLHELGHAKSAETDVTREFEEVLTLYLGLTGAEAVLA